MSWLTKAQANQRGVQPLLYLPADFTGDKSEYQAGIDLAMRDIQWFYHIIAGKTFRRRGLETARGDKPAVWFETQGAKEGFEEIIRACGKNPADAYNVFVCFTPAPRGWVGGTIGVDNWVGNFGGTYPWPGRTGLQGRGLDIMCGLPDPAPNPNEWWSDEIREWRGAIAHELGHCFCGLPHPDDDPSTTAWEPGESLMFSWWNYPGTGLLPSEIEKLRASPFLR